MEKENKMEKEITLQDIERRLAALETTVATLTADRNGGQALRKVCEHRRH
jgi:hypothetical protein